jgi:dihydroneopterin aldolase
LEIGIAYQDVCLLLRYFLINQSTNQPVNLSTSTPTFSIQLNHLRIFGYHGLHEEEKILGNEVEINILMKVKTSKEDKVSINDTINYADVYAVVKEIFKQREDLLETICINIATAIKNKFPQLRKISIQLIKLHPPIVAFVGSVSVTYEKKYK